MWLGFHSFLWLVGSAAVWLTVWEISAPRPEVLPRRLGVHLEGTWWQAGNVGEQWWQPDSVMSFSNGIYGIWVCFTLVSSDTTSSIRSSLIFQHFWWNVLTGFAKSYIRRSITFVSNFLHFFIFFDILWWVFYNALLSFRYLANHCHPSLRTGNICFMPRLPVEIKAVPEGVR